MSRLIQALLVTSLAGGLASVAAQVPPSLEEPQATQDPQTSQPPQASQAPPAGCNADNCARAVTGTGNYMAPPLSVRLARCSEALAVTVTPAIQTVTVTVASGTTMMGTTNIMIGTDTTALTGTPTSLEGAVTMTVSGQTSVVTAPATTLLAQPLAARQLVAPVCGNMERFSSACACWAAVTPTTVQAPAPVVTVTMTGPCTMTMSESHGYPVAPTKTTATTGLPPTNTASCSNPWPSCGALPDPTCGAAEDNCWCFTVRAADGTDSGSCIGPAAGCGEPCATSADCGAGEGCVLNSCCNGDNSGTCVSLVQFNCPNLALPSRMFRRNRVAPAGAPEHGRRASTAPVDGILGLGWPVGGTGVVSSLPLVSRRRDSKRGLNVPLVGSQDGVDVGAVTKLITKREEGSSGLGRRVVDNPLGSLLGNLPLPVRRRQNSNEVQLNIPVIGTDLNPLGKREEIAAAMVALSKEGRCKNLACTHHE